LQAAEQRNVVYDRSIPAMLRTDEGRSFWATYQRGFRGPQLEVVSAARASRWGRLLGTPPAPSTITVGGRAWHFRGTNATAFGEQRTTQVARYLGRQTVSWRVLLSALGPICPS